MRRLCETGHCNMGGRVEIYDTRYIEASGGTQNQQLACTSMSNATRVYVKLEEVSAVEIQQANRCINARDGFAREPLDILWEKHGSFRGELEEVTGIALHI